MLILVRNFSLIPIKQKLANSKDIALSYDHFSSLHKTTNPNLVIRLRAKSSAKKYDSTYYLGNMAIGALTLI